MPDASAREYRVSERFDSLGVDEPDREFKLGIMGGTFDPIHLGHLACAEQARDVLALDAVLFMPSGHQPFKRGGELATPEQRFELCRLAVRDNPSFDVSPLEVDREGVTYTVDTLRELRAHYPDNVTLYFIAGSDAISTLMSWRDAAELSRLAVFVGINRPDGGRVIDDALRGHLSRAGFVVEFIKAPALEISSSDLRERLAQGRSIRYMTSEAVRRRIERIESYKALRQEEERMPQSTRFESAEEGIEAIQEADAPLQRDEGNPYSKSNYKYMKSLLKQRVKASRFEHSVGVAKTARLMAKAYGVDPDLARMAGLLHDWDKCLTDAELRDRVDSYGIELSAEIVHDMPWLLHGPTAAAVLADEYPEFDHSLCQAIARHTLGAPNMSKLDMIVYVADKIEPGHHIPVYRKLYDRIGRMELFELYFAVQQENLIFLIDSARPLNHEAVSVWNHCLKLRA